MDRHHLACRLWTLTLAAAVLLVGGMACNDHALNPFGASVRSGAVERTEQGEVRPVDILFVVDNSNSMCEEQAGLRDNFDAFIDILAEANADFQLAVVNTDMRDVGGGVGQFRTGPGTYMNSAACSLDELPDTTYCNNLTLFPDGNPWLSASNYDLSAEMGVQRLQDEFACLGLTGIDGYRAEMGLGAMQKAINRQNQQDFFRDGALLAVVFVTDENDCFDGTEAFTLGDIVAEIERPDSGAGESLCEFNRNIEDSCTVTAEMPGPTIEINGEAKTVRQWCVEGDSQLIGENFGQFAMHLNCRENPDSCPRTVEQQLMTRRADIYQDLLNIVAAKNGYEDPQEAAGDVIVAAIINRDGGVRFNPPQETQFVSDPWCGDFGTQGYRYELFAEMFPEDRRIVFPICENDMNTNFADALGNIAEVIGKAINSVCLQAPPMQCDVDGLAEDGSCKPGKRCCPEGQACDGGPWLPGTDFEYRTCSGFTVNVELESTGPDGEPVRTPLVNGEDYTVNLESTACISSTGSPVEVGFTSAPPAGSQLVVSYPREVGAVFE